MNPEFQRPRARQQHLAAMEVGNTCIDCHKGIAHKNVRTRLTDAEIETFEKPVAEYIRQIPESYRVGLQRADEREKAAEAKRKADIDLAVKAAIAALPPPAPAPSPTPGAAPTAMAAAPAPMKAGGIDWAKVEAKTLGFFYPGQASYEWVQNGRDHGGARAFLKGGDRCVTCHDKETHDMGAKIVSGEKAEDTPIPGKRGSVDVKVQVARDAERIHFRFEWQKGPHAPVPFAEGGKLDPKNAAKFTVMFSGQAVKNAELAGCWVTCHADARTMPDTPKKEALDAATQKEVLDLANGVLKYIAESRTSIEIKEPPRGGWDKLLPKDEILALPATGAAMEWLRWREAEEPEHGLILADRRTGGLSPVTAEGGLVGETYAIVISRPLKAQAPGEVAFEPGKKVIVSFALHDDYTNARFHHVSLAYELALDGAAEFVAKAQ